MKNSLTFLTAHISFLIAATTAASLVVASLSLAVELRRSASDVHVLSAIDL